jgi:ABC-2 type transport system permease protein
VSPYVAGFVGGAKRALGAPGELSVRVGFYAVILVVFASLWDAAVAANDGDVAGYDYAAMLWYVVAAEACVIATKPRMIEDIGNDIGSGAIVVEMLRPVSVVALRLAIELGESVVRLAFAALVGGLFAWWRVGAPPRAPGALLALPAALLGIAVNLGAQHAFASAGFWLEDAKASWFLYQKLIFLLGGMLLPLELFPGWLAAAARALPFWTMSYVPARLLSGHVEPGLLAIQGAWLVATWALAAWTFRAGERHLQVAGG